MSVVEVRPFSNSQGGVDAEGNRTYTNLYDVYTDDKNDGSITARFAPGIPAHGDSWEWYNDSDDYALCVTRNAELIDVEATRKKWRVTCTFTTALQRRDPSGGDRQDPDNEPWKISGSFATGTKVVTKDKDGEVNCNSVQEPVFDEIPTGSDTLILEGHTSTINLVTRAAAMFKTNEKPMWGLDARRLLLVQWSWDIGYRGTVPFVHNRLEWHVATDDGINDKWNHVYVDFGQRILVNVLETDPELRYKSINARDERLVNGVYLDGSGGEIDLSITPGGYVWTDENIPEYDFIANMPFLPDPLPGPFV